MKWNRILMRHLSFFEGFSTGRRPRTHTRMHKPPLYLIREMCSVAIWQNYESVNHMVETYMGETQGISATRCIEDDFLNKHQSKEEVEFKLLWICCSCWLQSEYFKKCWNSESFTHNHLYVKRSAEWLTNDPVSSSVDGNALLRGIFKEKNGQTGLRR